MRRPVIYISQILSWADAFHARIARYPKRNDGRIVGQLGLTWCAVDVCLKAGCRGQPGGSSLARLLLKQRGRRHKGLLPPYRLRHILAWADAYHVHTGRWPNADSGIIPEAPGETWHAVESALDHGCRGLPGGSSLAQLLAERRDVRNRLALPDLPIEQVLAWADRHHMRTGKWPTRKSGLIPGAKHGETWATVNSALILGQRGLAGYGSLSRLLAARRSVPNRKALPPLTETKIVRWAKAYRRQTGRWPGHTDGEIEHAGGVTWSAIESALRVGTRGLPGGDSLYQLLRRNGRNGRAAKA